MHTTGSLSLLPSEREVNNDEIVSMASISQLHANVTSNVSNCIMQY